MSSTTRDVVIIGAGHNGLVAACYLARSGLDVEVLERDTVVGGAVSTVERFPGVRMDRGSSAHIMIRQTGIIEELDLASHGLVYQDLDPWGFAPVKNAAGDQQAIVFWVDLEATCASIAEICGQQDADGYRRFVRDWLPRNKVVFDFFARTPSPLNLGRTLTSLRRVAPAGVTRMTREMLGSADAVLDYYFTDERLKSALSWMAAQSGPPSHEPATADLVGWLTMLHHMPPGHPVGGSGMLSQSLASALAAAGGTLTLGDGAERILTKNDAVTGVRLLSGRTINATTIVAASHIHTTAGLLAHEHEELATDIRRRARTGNGLGMVVRAHTRAIPHYPADHDRIAHRAMVLLADSRRELRANYGQYLAGERPTNPAALVMAPSKEDTTLAPTGEHTVTIWGQWHAHKLADGSSWSQHRDTEAAKLVAVVDKWAPGFADSVINLWTQTPADLERELGLINGNVMHLEMSLDQMFSLRPLPEHAQYRIAGISGLYLAGASTHPGGGVFGASGRSAARTVQRDRRSIRGIRSFLRIPSST